MVEIVGSAPGDESHVYGDNHDLVISSLLQGSTYNDNRLIYITWPDGKPRPVQTKITIEADS